MILILQNVLFNFSKNSFIFAKFGPSTYCGVFSPIVREREAFDCISVYQNMLLIAKETYTVMRA